MRRNKQTGLTLIEILVAMGILILLLAILYTVFSISLRGWKKSDNLLRVSTAARFALEQMSREISSAVIKNGSNAYYCIGFDRDNPSGWRNNSIADEFYFIAPLKPDNPDSKGASDLCEVGYWLDGQGTEDEKDDVLKRFYVTDDRKKEPIDPEFDFNFTTGRSDEFVLNVRSLVFEFYGIGDTDAEATWDSRSDGSLAKIVIRIKVGIGEGTPETNPDFVVQDFTTAVSLRQ